MTEYLLHPDMPLLNDLEDDFVPAGLPPVIDGHVHVFPDTLFAAVRGWFDEHGWTIRYQLGSEEAIAFLLDRGVSHIVALQYAHKPGLADSLNAYMAGLCRRFAGRLSGLATVFPGEEDGAAILRRAFDLGLSGCKLHVHVQCCDINAEYMAPLYRCCLENDKPMLIHIGREPRSSAYGCDPYTLCRADKLEAVLREYPGLKICVPHLGFDETESYRRLSEKYETLWLDTTMILGDYFPGQPAVDLRRFRHDRIIYGSDFPNIPYAWDRELKALQAAGLPQPMLERLTWKNCAEFLALPTD